MPTSSTEHAVAAAAELIAGADALLICAGAGIGVDSGLPDFRGDEGFWRAYPPYAELGLSFAEVADPAHFAEDPYLAWGFYGHRLKLYRKTAPHKGFSILRHWSDQVPTRVFTSNVDGQFQAAGFADDHVAEVHGSIHHLQCIEPCTDEIFPAEDIDLIVEESDMRARNPLPRCPNCGAVARPNIAMFDDRTWLGSRSEERVRAVASWRRGLRSANLVTIEIGAGTAIPTVRRQAELASAASGAMIRVNPREPEVRHGRGVSLPMGALDALTAINALLP
jgi:NAD-dependent SIR2 family protein deacetylase